MVMVVTAIHNPPCLLDVRCMLTAGSQYVHFMSYQRVTLLLIGGYVQFSNDLGPSYMERASPLDF